MTTETRWPYRFALIELDQLFVDEDYQRPLTTFLQKIVDKYDPALVGTLKVSERNGRKRTRFAVIDGQTRLAGMREHEEPVAPCLVYTGLSQAEEADLFARFQTERRGMASYLRFRAALVAKKPEALAIAQIVSDEGFELGVRETKGTIKAIAALEGAYRVSPDTLRETMHIIKRAWPDPTMEYRTSADIITGIRRFLTDNPSLDQSVLIERLAGTTPRVVRHRANSLREGAGGAGTRGTYVGRALVGVYTMRG